MTNDPRKVGETWFSAYWRQSYTVTGTTDTTITVRWADGTTSTHATRLEPRDYLVTTGGILDEHGYYAGGIPDECVQDCSHARSCDADVEHWTQKLRLAETVAQLRSRVIAHLRECGAWDDLQDADNETLAQRLLWTACCDIRESGEWLGLFIEGDVMEKTTAITSTVTDKGGNIVPLPSEQVRQFVRASKAESTLRGYQSDWRDFCGWCEGHCIPPLPASPENVAAYIAECAQHLKPGSIQRRLNAIAEAHKAAGADSPTSAGIVRNTLKGIRRTLGTAPTQKAPTLTADIRAIVAATDPGLIGARDRALVLLGFAGAFRRSELVNLDLADLDFSRDGLTVILRRSKTDQVGHGRKIGIPYGANPETCPVRTVQSWLEQAAITGGQVFRSVTRHGHVQAVGLSGTDVARVVKKLAERAGLDAGKYSGHSLRAGHATAAAIAGASERSIMKQTGHSSVQMVRRYIRDGNLFRENSAGKLGL